MSQNNNHKTIPKKQVLEIINSGAKLHQEYTNFFEEELVNNFIKRDRIYELPNERFLYVFDEKGPFIRGKGIIYEKEYFLKFMRLIGEMREDVIHRRTSAVSHWQFYSKHQNNIVNLQEQLITGLAAWLKIDEQKLDNSYASLDLISSACKQHDIKQLYEELYDNLVFYVGEVIRKRVNGFWAINEARHDHTYPFISINVKYVHYMPVNVVWYALIDLNGIDLRKEAANEVRRNGWNAKQGLAK